VEVGREREDVLPERDVREIAARYSPRMIDFLGWLLALVFERIYDGVDVDEAGIEAIRRQAAHSPIIVCPSHKSHIDYLVMSFVFYRRNLVPPHIAAGINLSFWPLGTSMPGAPIGMPGTAMPAMDGLSFSILSTASAGT
jgi:glycerol-3-phosphate O-acyltransferase